jgi:hypothetical protein
MGVGNVVAGRDGGDDDGGAGDGEQGCKDAHGCIQSRLRVAREPDDADEERAWGVSDQIAFFAAPPAAGALVLQSKSSAIVIVASVCLYAHVVLVMLAVSG